MGSVATPPQDRGKRMVQKIALEEHFLSPELIEYWRPTMTEVAPAATAQLFKRLSDFGDLRLETMDKAGIAKAVLSVSGPGVQAERDATTATRRAASSNDFLAMRALPTSRYRTRRPPPTNSSAACAISSSAAP